VWRPTTQQVVGFLWNGANNLGPTSNKNVEWYGTPNIVTAADFFTTGTTAFTGLTVPQSTASAVTTENGDVLVVEIWGNVYPKQDMGGAGTRTFGINTTSTVLNYATTITWGTAAPTGENFPSDAQPLSLSPMLPANATSSAARVTNAQPLSLSPMLPADATSLVNRAPVFSNASPFLFTGTAGAATTNTLTKSYTSDASKFTFTGTTPATTATSAKQVVAVPTPPAQAYTLTGAAATSSQATGSNAVSTSYALSQSVTPSKDVYAVVSVASATSYALSQSVTPVSSVYRAYSNAAALSYALSAPPTTIATTVRIYTSSADAIVYGPLSGKTANVNVTSAASLATFTLEAADAFTGQQQAVLSTALASSYAVDAKDAFGTIAVGQIAHTSDASPTSYAVALAAFPTTNTRGYASNAVAISYTLAAPVTTGAIRAWISSTTANAYTHSGATTTNNIGRVYTSDANVIAYTLTAPATTAANIVLRPTSNANAISYTLAAPATTTGIVNRVYASDANAISYTLAAAVNTAAVVGRVYASDANYLAYSHTAANATSAYVPTAGDVGIATYTFMPSMTTRSTVQGFSAATPPLVAYTLAGAPTTTQRAYASDANKAAYTHAGGDGTGNIGRSSNALAAGYAIGLTPQTKDTSAVASIAMPVSYEHTGADTAYSIGRVIPSDAMKASYALGANFTNDTVDAFSVATAVEYSASNAPTSVDLFTPVAGISIASPGEYSLDAKDTGERIGRIHTSQALSTGYSVTPIDATSLVTRPSIALSTSYSLTTKTANVKIDTIAFLANYSHEGADTSRSLGRVYTSDAAYATYSHTRVNGEGLVVGNSNALPTSYTQTSPATTAASIRRVYTSVALVASYNLDAKDVGTGFVIVTLSDAAKAAYTSFVGFETYGYTYRVSNAVPFTFTGLAGAQASFTGFTLVSIASPIEYLVSANPTTVSLGLITHSIALPPTAFKLSGNFTGDFISKTSNASPTSYALTAPTTATSRPTKDSNAVAAGFFTYWPDAWSGRVVYSNASSVSFSLSTSAVATSAVPSKYTSVASSTTYAATAPTTTVARRGYGSHAVRADYGSYIFQITEVVPTEIKPPIVYPTYTPRAAITDSQFALWLEDEHAIRVTLIETQCIQPDSGSTELAYFASSGFVTKYEDGSPTFYAPLMRGGLDFAQTLDLDLSGTHSYGDIELDNTTGELDWMFERVWLYQKFKAYIGDATWPRRDFRQIFDGTVEDVDSSQRDTVNMRLRDKLYRLEVPLHETKIGGLTTNADRLVPVTMGECHNVTPFLSNATQLYYVYHVKPAEGPIEVRDNGIPISHIYIPGGPATFKLNKQPYGRITCSVQGDRTNVPVASGGGYCNTVSPVVYRLMTEYGTEIPNRFTLADIDLDNFTAFDIANKASIGLYQTERMTVLAACQTVAASVGARVTMNALGKAQLVRLQLPPSTEPANLCYNGNFRSGMDGWFWSGGTGPVPDGYVGFNLDPGGGWNLPGGYTFYTHQAGRYGNPASYYEYGGPPILVEPNKRYTVSALIGAHRAMCQVCFWEYDFAGTLLGSSPLAATSINDADPLYPGGNTVASYKKCYDSKVTSPTTHYIRVLLRKWDTKLGEPDSWLFATNVVVDSETTAISAPIIVTESDMVAGSLHIEDRLPIVAGVNLGYCKNWTLQEDTASGVPEEHKAMYAREWLTVAITDVSMRSKYNLWGEPEQENTLLLEKQSASTECQRRVNLRSTQRHVYSFVGFARLMFTPIGAAMTLKHPRFGLAAGKTGQVISVAVNWLTSQVTIKVLI
jgi:hypothetical protein